MNLLRFIGGRAASAPVARERLQILLAHERGLRGRPDLLGVLRAEILAVVSRHIVLDPEKVIVTNPEVSSVRDSDRIIGMLDSKTIKAERGERVEKHVLITRYDSARASRGEMLSIDDILEILATPLLGIIPESQDVLRASNVGSPVTLNNAASAPARAYTDAVRRLMGETVTMTVPVESKGLMNRFFGRRAA